MIKAAHARCILICALFSRFLLPFHDCTCFSLSWQCLFIVTVLFLFFWASAGFLLSTANHRHSTRHGRSLRIGLVAWLLHTPFRCLRTLLCSCRASLSWKMLLI